MDKGEESGMGGTVGMDSRRLREGNEMSEERVE